MPLSSRPAGGPSIPAGATKVSIKDIDTSSSAKNVDVTDLSDTERKYAAPPLKDGGTSVADMTCTASGTMKTDTTLAVSDKSVKTGWVCTDYEKVYEVGKYATWSANFSHYPSTSSNT